MAKSIWLNLLINIVVAIGEALRWRSKNSHHPLKKLLLLSNL